MAYFVALDGGGTKTECWVANESRVLGQASGPTVKIMNVGQQTATENLRTVVREALGAAGVPGDAVACTCFGLAGLDDVGVGHDHAGKPFVCRSASPSFWPTRTRRR